MNERELLAERLREVADIDAKAGDMGCLVSVRYLCVRINGVGSTEEEATTFALLALADQFLQARDHVALLLAPPIDPSKRQVLPRVAL